MERQPTAPVKSPMGFSKEYQIWEERKCNCDKRGNLPTLHHQNDCKFLKIMNNPRCHYHSLKVIQDNGNETREKLEILKADVAEVKSELVEIKAMMGDFLALFRASRESG